MKKIFKTFIVCFVVMLTLAIGICANALETITVDLNRMNIVLDGERVFADNFVIDGTTYVPLRRIAEMLGKSVVWEKETNSALINDTDTPEITNNTTSGTDTQVGTSILVDRNTMNIVVNGTKVAGDNFVYNNTTYVPLREISQMFNQEVYWERFSNTAHIGERGITIFDGRALGAINGLEYTDYVYDYYKSSFTEAYDYYESMGLDPVAEMGGTVEELVMKSLSEDYTLLDYAQKNGMSMTTAYNVAYYKSINDTLKNANNDWTKLNYILQTSGYTSVNSYYYSIVLADLLVQYSKQFESQVTEEEIIAFYEENPVEAQLDEVRGEILRILTTTKAQDDLAEKAKNAVIVKY